MFKIPVGYDLGERYVYDNIMYIVYCTVISDALASEMQRSTYFATRNVFKKTTARATYFVKTGLFLHKYC